MKKINNIFYLFLGILSILFFSYNAIYSEVNQNNYRLAAKAYNNGDYLTAIKEYERIMKRGDILGYLNLAIIFKDLGRYQEAIEVLEKAKVKFNNEIKILSLLANLYYLNHNIDQAIKVFQEIINRDTNNLEANLGMGLCYVATNRDQEAQKYLEKVIFIDKNNILAHIELAGIYQRQRKNQQAINEYKKVTLIDASLIKIQKILADLLLEVGEMEEALKIYRRISLKEPEDNYIKNKISEISDKLGREYFMKEREKLILARKHKRILVKPFKESLGIPLLRIGLAQNIDVFDFKCLSDFLIETKFSKNLLFKGRENEIYRISYQQDKEEIVIFISEEKSIISKEPILIIPNSKEGIITIFNLIFGQESFWMNQFDRSFRGVIEIDMNKKGLKIINILNVEEYLYSVIPSEMPADWEEEALKAQTIASRTITLKKVGRHRQDGFDLCAEVHCQAYFGVEKETERVNKIVDETRGMIMTHNDNLIYAFYSSNCGGHTQDNQFNYNQDIPYLKGKPDTLEKNIVSTPFSPLELENWLRWPSKEILCNVPNSNFRWIRIYMAEEIDKILNKSYNLGNIRNIIVLKRNNSGHISAVKIVGTKLELVIEKELNIRQTLGGLKSSLFKIEIKKDSAGNPQKFIFYGGGFGHGIGMCQYGANSLAKKGKNYKEILRHYFGDFKLKKLY